MRTPEEISSPAISAQPPVQRWKATPSAELRVGGWADSPSLCATIFSEVRNPQGGDPLGCKKGSDKTCAHQSDHAWPEPSIPSNADEWGA